MREIKFRAWLKEKHKMINVNDINLKEKDVNEGFFSFYEIELMQYTGIKDKNGKEIYEGDIVFIENGFYYKIVFENASFKAKYGQYPLTINLNEIAPYCEVVGNIYENPELLGG